MIPSELRHLLFRPTEVVEAVKEYYRRTGQSIPAGAILRCSPETVAGGTAVQFRITIIPNAAPGAPSAVADPPSRDVIIEGPILAAALILYCHDRRIPLPSSAEKSLQLFGKSVCLLVTINPRGEGMPSLQEMQL